MNKKQTSPQRKTKISVRFDQTKDELSLIAEMRGYKTLAEYLRALIAKDIVGE